MPEWKARQFVSATLGSTCLAKRLNSKKSPHFLTKNNFEKKKIVLSFKKTKVESEKIYIQQI